MHIPKSWSQNMSGIYSSRERSPLSLSAASGLCGGSVSPSLQYESHLEQRLSDQAALDYVLRLPELLLALSEGMEREVGSYLPYGHRKLRPYKERPLSYRPKILRYSYLPLLY